MSEPSLPLPSDDPADDLPRTFRRERDARAKEAREREEREQREAEARKARGEYGAPHAAAPPATVTGIDVPFAHLVMFFLKASVAAVPALLVLGAILFLVGTVIAQVDPGLVPIQIKFGYK